MASALGALFDQLSLAHDRLGKVWESAGLERDESLALDRVHHVDVIGGPFSAQPLYTYEIVPGSNQSSPNHLLPPRAAVVQNP